MMNQKAIVARALSEVLKIVGALGVVNVFTLSMVNSASILHRSGMTEPAGAVESLDHFLIRSEVRNIFDPDLAAILCGAAMILMFLRLVYGSIILMYGDYESDESPFDRIQRSDFVSLGSLMLIFPILSYYGGAGELKSFSWFLVLAIIIDAISMIFGQKEGETKSLYIAYRRSWVVINSITIVLFIVGFLLSSVIQDQGRFIIDPYRLNGYFILVYCAMSAVDLWWNKAFYLGLAQAPAAPAPAPANAQHRQL